MRVVPITITERTQAPIRTCIGCRRRRSRASMHRCVLTHDGTVRLNLSESGRGAWVCGVECLETVVRRRALSRAWRRPLSGDLEAALVLDLQQRLTATDSPRGSDVNNLEGGDEHAEEHSRS
jgi:predicted RNA-binding protein YlxR (DUF448 family)